MTTQQIFTAIKINKSQSVNVAISNVHVLRQKTLRQKLSEVNGTNIARNPMSISSLKTPKFN